MATRLSVAARNAAANAIVALIDAGAGPGVIQIRTGPQPALADDPASGTLLVTLTFSDPAFAAAILGVATMDNTPVLSALGVANGTAGWFRVLDSNGNTVGDGAVSTAGAELNMDTTTVNIGAAVQITAGTAMMPSSS